MEKRYYIDGKCVLSYDDDVFSTDDDYTNIKELFIYPAVDKVYVKYYEKQLVQQVLEKTLKKNDSIFNTYCAIKELIKDEPISVDYVQSEEDTLLKNLMRKNLNSTRVKDKRRAASTRAGGVGERYTCVVDGKEIFLFYEDNNMWFMERAGA